MYAEVWYVRLSVAQTSGLSLVPMCLLWHLAYYVVVARIRTYFTFPLLLPITATYLRHTSFRRNDSKV